ncbi:MAG: ferredoxin family protein [Ignavibacteriales bacterium]
MGKKGVAISIDPRLCKQCGICIEFCPKDVLAPGQDGVPAVLSPGSCTLCRLCELRCPDFAIEVEEGEDGRGT